VNYFVDEVDDSSSGRSSRMRCLVQHEPAGSHSTARTSLVPWTAGDGHLVGSSGVKAMLVAADGALQSVVSRSSAAGAGRAGFVRTASGSLLASTVRAGVSAQAGPGDRTDW
jgi:hypothetical protein